MKITFRITVFVIAAGISWWLWMVFFPSPAQIITKRLKKLAAAATVEDGQGIIPRMLAAQGIASYFTTNVILKIDVPGHHEDRIVIRDDIATGVAAAKVQMHLIVKASDILVSVDPSGENAQAEATVQVHLQGEHDISAQQVRFTLKKIDGQWLISQVQTVRTFSRLAHPYLVSTTYL